MFIRKYWVPLSAFLVATAIAFFFLRSDVPQEPVKIYKTTTPAQRAKSEKTIQALSLSASRDDTERTNTDTAEGGDFHADGTWHAEPHSQPQPHTPTRPVPDADVTEDEVSEWVAAELEILASQMEAKYPEIAELAELTPREIYKRYPTPEARDEFRSLTAEARAEFFDDIRDLFSLLPVDVVEAALEEIRQDLTENWGAEMVGEIISEIRAEMGL